MGSWDEVQKSRNNKTGDQVQNDMLAEWARQRQGSIDGSRGFFTSLLNWPMDKFQDYRVNQMLTKFNPEKNNRRNLLLKEIQGVYGDGVIDENEAKSDAVYQWHKMLKGEGI